MSRVGEWLDEHIKELEAWAHKLATGEAPKVDEVRQAIEAKAADLKSEAGTVEHETEADAETVAKDAEAAGKPVAEEAVKAAETVAGEAVADVAKDV